jgi:GNAT superfamily N-acetyltransferase
MASSAPYVISSEPARLQREWIVAALRETYWAAERPEEQTRQALERSLCFGAYLADEGGEHQVGFARVVTDEATHAWIADVVVDPSHRSRGIGKALIAAVLADPRLQNVTFHLGTLDAQALYQKFGFVPHQTMRRGASVPPRPDVG